ncbi:phosphatase PAP2 family protein [Neorhizobium sp. CSC1952]|uniref:phosphatase PAP2 family protein n=1 Tax=Neorhizobium sp. CSC1952 TaxID=2978974 RepID=UPI0025A4CD8D|nr:phosphatase PAP2 family protein [Rhizobium sp. CSC1952]WJR68933.1 phosphatase PAP2 family protein [Rhizobium sp. CSC1952]
MRKTIQALKRRRLRCQETGSIPCYWWSYALITGNLILVAFLLLDAPVGSYITRTPRLLESVGETITDLGKSGWIIFATLLIFFEAVAAYRLSDRMKGRFQALLVAHLAAYVFFSVALSGLLANLLKRMIGRARPMLYDEWTSFGLHSFAGSRFESFPSGHATTAGALMMAMALIAPSYRLLFLIMALWVGFSRVIVGAHYPSDVIAGLALGAGFSVAMAIVFSRHGLLFRQRQDGWPVLRRPIPLVMRPDRANTVFPPRGIPLRPEMARRTEQETRRSRLRRVFVGGWYPRVGNGTLIPLRGYRGPWFPAGRSRRSPE